jgi:hypothetical protein
MASVHHDQCVLMLAEAPMTLDPGIAKAGREIVRSITRPIDRPSQAPTNWRAIIALLLLIVQFQALAGPAAADGTSPTTPPATTPPATAAAIQAVISHQMAAFRRDDAGTAFQDASPYIQSKFGRPDFFLQMVRDAYAPVYRPRQVEFRGLVQTGMGLDQQVFIIAPDGRAYLAHYLMQQQPDGSWRINSCLLEALSDQST